jgi:hypothetical protein
MNHEEEMKRAFYGRGAEHDVAPSLPKAAPPQPDHSAQPVAYVLHKNGEIDWDQETVISNTGGDEQDERWKWVPVYAQPLGTVQGDAQLLFAWAITDINGDFYFSCDKRSPNDKPLYKHADAGEVEALSIKLRQVQAAHAVERSTLRAQLAERDALLRGLVEYADGLLSDNYDAWCYAGSTASRKDHTDADYLAAKALIAASPATISQQGEGE